MTVTHYLLSHFSRFSVSQCLKMWPLKRHFCFHLCVFGLALFQQYARTLWKSSGRGLVCKNENCIWISTGMIPLCFVYAQMAFVEEKESRSLTMQTCGSVCWLYVKSLALLKRTLTKKKSFWKVDSLYSQYHTMGFLLTSVKSRFCAVTRLDIKLALL